MIPNSSLISICIENNLPNFEYPAFNFGESIATRKAFGAILDKFASEIPNLIGGSADLEPSNYTGNFAETYRDFSKTDQTGRNIPFGVREFPMAAMMNGLALHGGLIPFGGTFLVFADYERPALRLGALQNIRVIHEFTHDSFYVGEDGPTHSGNYDLVYLRCIPNMIVMTPSDENETRKLLTTGFFHNGPASIRYPRGSGPNVDVENDLTPIEIGKGRLITEESKNLIIINFGALLDQAKEVANTLGLTLIDMRFVKPLDEDILRKYLSEAEAFVSIEDGSVAGGAGSAVQEFCSDNNINIKSKLFGIPDVFIEHQSREEMIEESGLTASKIIKEIEELRLVK